MMKSLQVLGNLIPFLLMAFAYYLFGDMEPGTPSYVGTTMFLLWMGIAVLAVVFVFLFIMPSSFILSHAENREYFDFKSIFWISVLVINWLFIGFYCVCVLAFMFSFVGNPPL